MKIFTMPKLISCTHCGSSISTEAFACPVCKNCKPHGEPCNICGALANPKDLLEGSHASCLKDHFSDSSIFQCRTCKAILIGIQVCHEGQECPKCGDISPYAAVTNFCHFCHLPFHPKHEVVWGLYEGYYESDPYTHYRYHSFCRASDECHEQIACARKNDAQTVANERSYSIIKGCFIMLGIAIALAIGGCVMAVNLSHNSSLNNSRADRPIQRNR